MKTYLARHGEDWICLFEDVRGTESRIESQSFSRDGISSRTRHHRQSQTSQFKIKY